MEGLWFGVFAVFACFVVEVEVQCYRVRLVCVIDVVRQFGA